MPSSLSSFPFDLIFSAVVDTCEQAQRLHKFRGTHNEADQKLIWDTGMIRITTVFSSLTKYESICYV